MSMGTSSSSTFEHDIHNQRHTDKWLFCEAVGSQIGKNSRLMLELCKGHSLIGITVLGERAEECVDLEGSELVKGSSS